jgi:metal-dependent amidase/aminoacylase/carboxypeptidase family protein
MTGDVVSAELLSETIAIRRDLYTHPELSFEEERTAAIVAKLLRGLGLAVYEGIGKTGVVGVLSGSLPGPTVMLRADMDALPIQDAGDASYRSQTNGVSHACGHDAHVAMLLGAQRSYLPVVPESCGDGSPSFFSPAKKPAAAPMQCLTMGSSSGSRSTGYTGCT